MIALPEFNVPFMAEQPTEASACSWPPNAASAAPIKPALAKEKVRRLQKPKCDIIIRDVADNSAAPKKRASFLTYIFGQSPQPN